jgi:S1-C subfamily serine protease
MRRGLAIIPQILVLAVALGWLYGSPVLRADQSAEEATAILTSGEWQFGGRNPGRFFKADGTYTSTNPTGGTWKISNKAVEIHIGNVVYLYPLPVKPEGTSGNDRKGRQSMLVRMDSAPSRQTAGERNRKQIVPSAVSTLRTTESLRQTAAQIIQDYHSSFVFVTGTSAAGSGFIAKLPGGNFLVTNAHVAAGIRDAQFRNLDGATVRGDVPSLAIGEDIFCMSMPAGGRPLQIMDDVDVNAAIGDPVVVLGNAEGGGVVNPITGKIVGIGPGLVEVDAPFVPGNSGSPIIHLKTGKVIGVATYLIIRQYDAGTDKKLDRPMVRRFGYRIDNIKGWQSVSWPSFYAQAVEMEAIEQRTKDLEQIFRNPNGLPGSLLISRLGNPLISSHYADWMAAHRHHHSPEDVAQADTDFLAFLRNACEEDVTAAQSQITYDYFRRELADQQQERDEMAKGLGEFIQAVQN